VSHPAVPACGDVAQASKPIPDAVHKRLGVALNIFQLIAQSPAALQEHLPCHMVS
jgi:hypothetical protein